MIDRLRSRWRRAAPLDAATPPTVRVLDPIAGDERVGPGPAPPTIGIAADERDIPTAMRRLVAAERLRPAPTAGGVAKRPRGAARGAAAPKPVWGAAVVATRGASYVKVGDRYPLGGLNVTSNVVRTGRTARLDDYSDASGNRGDYARVTGVRSVVAAPVVVVDGRTWGVLAAIWTDRGPPPEDTEVRLAGFAELLDTAIANADSRVELTASRARLLAAGDEARRRVARDLHDAQQRLVHTVVTLKLAQQALPGDPGRRSRSSARHPGTAQRATDELRELARGILPGALTRGGLRAGVEACVSRLALPVEVDVTSERLAPDIEASAYFIVAEALTNVVKHARASGASVRGAVQHDVLELEVADDGVGGADPEGRVMPRQCWTEAVQACLLAA